MVCFLKLYEIIYIIYIYIYIYNFNVIYFQAGNEEEEDDLDIWGSDTETSSSGDEDVKYTGQLTADYFRKKFLSYTTPNISHFFSFNNLTLFWNQPCS